MPLEDASKISELVTTNPEQSDPVGEGNEHIQNIKKAVQFDAMRFSTIALAADSSKLVEGALISIDELVSGEDGHDWDVVDITSVTPNGVDIVACTNILTLAIVLRKFSNLQTDVSNLQTDVSNLQGSVSSVQSDVNSLQGNNVNSQIGTAYQLVATDADAGEVRMDNASPNTVTIPLDSTELLPERTIIITQLGAGTTSIAAVVGVSLNDVDGGFVNINAQYSGAALTKIAPNTYIVTGNITEVA